MNFKKNLDSSKIQWWEKQLRAPIASLFVMLSALVIWTTSNSSAATLPTEEAPVILCSNQVGDNLKATLKNAIMSAKSSIVILIFSLTDPDIIQALKEKAASGVKITIVHDAVATQDIAFKLGPNVALRPRREKGLMHDKILSIDHEDVWLGSSNLTKDSLTMHANLMVGIRSKTLAETVEKKAMSMLERKRVKLSPIAIQTNDQVIELWFFPDQPEGLKRLQSRLQAATKSIKVAMFTFTYAPLINDLIAAHNRGVEVTVVLDEESAQRTSKKAFLQLKRAGVPTYVSSRVGLLHEKMAIIDDTILAIGSANWTKAAFFSNDDNLCFLIGLTAQQKNILGVLWAQTLKEAKLSFTSTPLK